MFLYDHVWLCWIFNGSSFCIGLCGLVLSLSSSTVMYGVAVLHGPIKSSMVMYKNKKNIGNQYIKLWVIQYEIDLIKILV